MIRLMQLLRPYRRAVVAIVVLLFLQALTTLYLPNMMADIVDNGVVKGNVAYIYRVGALMLLVTLLSMACSVAAGYLSSKTSAAFGKTLRRNLFSHVERFMPHEFDAVGTSSLIVRTTNDVMQVQQFVTMLLRMMVRAPLMAIGGIIMAVYTDAHLSLILVVIMPLLAAVIWLVMRRGVVLFRLLQSKVDVFNRVARENLTGVRVIRAFDRSRYEASRLDDANRELTGVSANVFKVMALLMPVMMLVINVSTIAILWLGGLSVVSGAMQIGSLMAFIQYVTQIMFAVMMVSAMFFMLPRAQVSARRINEVFDIAPALKDPSEPRRVEEGSARVAFEHVGFRYPGAEKTVLTDVSFELKPGEVTAIIGGTGSGKTTLVSLLARFFDATEGQVKIGGIDVRELSQADLRQKIGFVPQKAVLFSGTIAENIRFGRSAASDADVRRAAATAQAAEFIDALEHGYETVIAQGGANLSGGQKQRLAMARALVREPQIYVFDDSFSALDYKTDAALRAALQENLRGAAALIVAQRVSTVMDANQIVVLDDGHVAGVGSHRALMQSCEVYREIVQSQLPSEGEIA